MKTPSAKVITPIPEDCLIRQTFRDPHSGDLVDDPSKFVDPSKVEPQKVDIASTSIAPVSDTQMATKG